MYYTDTMDLFIRAPYILCLGEKLLAQNAFIKWVVTCGQVGVIFLTYLYSTRYNNRTRDNGKNDRKSKSKAKGRGVHVCNYF